MEQSFDEATMGHAFSELRRSELNIPSERLAFNFCGQRLISTTSTPHNHIAQFTASQTVSRMADSSKNAPKEAKKGPSGLKLVYLITYNLVSTVAWLVLLACTVSVNGMEGPSFVYPEIGDWVRWTQTLAGLEILHAALGMSSFFSHPR